MLFDLDGTLIDTAPDLIDVANEIRRSFGLRKLPIDHYRGQLSNGVTALLHIALQSTDGNPNDPDLIRRFLMLYESRICNLSAPFLGIPELLDRIESLGIAWGIVTNKSQRLTHALLDGLSLSARAACVVAGDSVSRAKPAADPLLHACAQLNFDRGEVVYLGDSMRDIQAARCANIRSAVAGWGYLGAADQPETWGAETILKTPFGVLPWIGFTPANQLPRRPE